jgi:hypothetical protein
VTWIIIPGSTTVSYSYETGLLGHWKSLSMDIEGTLIVASVNDDYPLHPMTTSSNVVVRITFS